MVTPSEFERVPYEELESAQQENYNYHKISARLADFGYTTIRLYDDFEGADFIAKHVRGKDLLKVQLKGRLTFDEKYQRDDEEDEICIAFREGNDWYLYPHDTVFEEVVSERDIIIGTDSWEKEGNYHREPLGTALEGILEPYRLPELDDGQS